MVKEFIGRWWQWIAAAIGIVAALSAARRAEIRLGKANQRIQDEAAKQIEDGWDGIDEDVNDFLSSQKRASNAKDKLSKSLDVIAKSNDSAARTISDWNADNRLRDDEGVT